MTTFESKVYWENRLKGSFSLRGVGINRFGEQYNRWLYRVRRYVFEHRLGTIDHDLENATILDVGCGTGFYIARWEQAGAKKIVGVDITRTAVAGVQSLYPQHSFYQIDITSNIRPIKTYSFDIVSAFDVLFHIVEQGRYEHAIRNIYSLLKPGGTFVFSENFLHRETFVSAHQVCRKLDYIERLLLAAGFHIVERLPMFYLMNTPLDTTNSFVKAWWKVYARIIRTTELAGLLAGALLYPIEICLTSLAVESPTTEIMICKK